MKYAIEEFYDARFGMFIHWGLYSLLAGEWQGQRMDDIGEWIMSYHKIPIDEYEKLAARFNPTKFDADAIVRMARNAGMRYLVITSKHHEGFALFKSDADPYNVVDATPFGRDIIAELSQACRRHGMKFGVYYSQALDWHERNAGGWDDPAYLPARRPWANIWDFPDNTGKDFEEYFSRKVLPQVTELLTRYGDIFLIWFDTPRTISAEQSERLYRHVKALQPRCLVNSRIGNGMGDYRSLGDNQLPVMPLTFPTESPVTLNDTWGYKYYDHNWKDSRDIIDKRIRLAARNVNFLLNIGPRGDGSIPEETERILSQVGAWTAGCSEALEETRGNPSPYEFPWGSVTSKGNRLYFFMNDGAKTPLVLNGLVTKVRSVTALRDGGAVDFSQSDAGGIPSLRIALPKSDAYRPAYRVELAGPPVFSDVITDQDGVLSLYPHGAAALKDGVSQPIPRHGLGDRYLRPAYMAVEGSGALINWKDPGVSLVWKAALTRPGVYRARIAMPVRYNAKPAPVPRSLELIVYAEGGALEARAQWSQLIDSGIEEAAGPLALSAGPKRLVLRCADCAEDKPVALECVSLVLEGETA
jgi:alpha-L-fucosidase